MRIHDADPESKTDPSELPVVSGASFEEAVLGSTKPVVVDFFATWCGPCAWILPALESILGHPDLDVEVVKVDVKESPELAERFRIASVPTIVLFRNGREVGRSVGVEPERVLAMARDAGRPEADTDDKPGDRVTPGR